MNNTIVEKNSEQIYKMFQFYAGVPQTEDFGNWLEAELLANDLEDSLSDDMIEYYKKDEENFILDCIELIENNIDLAPDNQMELDSHSIWSIHAERKGHNSFQIEVELFYYGCGILKLKTSKVDEDIKDLVEMLMGELNSDIFPNVDTWEKYKPIAKLLRKTIEEFEETKYENLYPRAE